MMILGGMAAVAVLAVVLGLTNWKRAAGDRCAGCPLRATEGTSGRGVAGCVRARVCATEAGARSPRHPR